MPQRPVGLDIKRSQLNVGQIISLTVRKYACNNPVLIASSNEKIKANKLGIMSLGILAHWVF